jgi:flagellar motor switch protein FliM
MMNLCIPFNSIERIGNKLSANSWISYSKRPPTAESIGRVSRHIADAPVELIVELAETQITTNDLLGLCVGDIIASEKDVQQPLVVYVEGRPKFHATPGKYKGRKAICVQEDIQEQSLVAAPEEDSPNE